MEQGALAAETDTLDGETEREGSGSIGPELARGAKDAVAVGVEDAVIPATPALRELGEVGDGVQGGLEDALLPGAAVLIEEENVALAIAADLVDEVAEAGGVREVDAGAGFHAVAIAAGDEQVAGVAGEIDDGSILPRVTEAVELEGVDGGAGELEEAEHLATVGIGADPVQIPDGVIEDDEDTGEGVEVGEDGAQRAVGGLCGVSFKARGPGESRGGGEVVDAEMEFGEAERHCPLERDGDAAGAGDGAQQLRGGDGVVVGEGDQGKEPELGDLAGLDGVCHAGDEGRTPVGAVEVELDLPEGGAALVMAEDAGEAGDGGEQLVDEGEGFKRLAGVAVEGDAAREGSGTISLVPDACNGGSGVQGGCCHLGNPPYRSQGRRRNKNGL